MSNIKVCDRCGKRLVDEMSIFSLKPSRYTLTMTLFKKCTRYYSSTLEQIETTHDLCVDCTSKLSEWLEYESSLEENK